MLASRYKPNDPLAAEFIRTFRERNFHGRFFVDRYDALKVEGVKKTKVRLRMPSHRSSVELPDEVAFYGYRPTHSTMFYLSPWEFCQWFFPQKLRAPSAHYEFSKWTSEGKQKIKESDGQKLRGKWPQSGMTGQSCSQCWGPHFEYHRDNYADMRAFFTF